MKIVKVLSLTVFLSLFLGSCKDDKNSVENKKLEKIEQEKKAENRQKTEVKNHDGHNHDGHDHSDNKPKAIENGERVSVPIKSEKSKSGINPTPIKKMPVPQSNPNANSGIGNKMQSMNIKLPDACTLINESQLANIIGVDEGMITLKDGSSQVSPFARSCFFRWEHQGVPNSGVMVQVQVNPVPDELDDWAAYFIQAKLTSGEKTPDGSMTFKYTPMKGMGIDGGYNYDLHRYLWRDKQDIVYLVAFNLPATEEEELSWAKKIGKIVTKNTKI